MVRTRIAPSPTGEDIHIGNLYTALLNWAYARKHNGTFLIRIEDTDRTRYVPGAEQKIQDTLAAFGIDHDEGPELGGEYGPYYQSQRKERGLYQQLAEELVEKGSAYYSFCTKEELERIRAEKLPLKQELRKLEYAAFTKEEASDRIRKGEDYVIRLKVPEDTEISFSDSIRGEIRFHSKEIDDQVLLKSDGFPTYHLAVVVDDHLMQISHVIRAEEWISSTPKHVLLYQAFGWDLPVYAHVPILRNPNKSKLSKRKNPVWASWYLDQGYLPEAVLNYLALMGWSHPEQKEIFSREEFLTHWDIQDMEAVGPAFDPVKLEWMNGMYIRALSSEELKDKILTFYDTKRTSLEPTLVEQTIPLVQERIKTLQDYLPLAAFFFQRPKHYEVDLSDKLDLLHAIADRLEGISSWGADTIGEAMLALAQEKGVKNKQFFQVLRVAITGKKISPPLNESMEILGKKKCIERVRAIKNTEES